MVHGEHDSGSPENRVDARRKHADLFVTAFYCKIEVRALTAAHPVALAFQDLLRPARLNLHHVLHELFSIIRRPEKPLFEISLLYGCATTPADATRRLLV